MVWGAWSLQHRHRMTSEDGKEPELYIQEKDCSVPAGQSWLTACQQQRQTSRAGQHRTDGWGRAEQAGVGMEEPNAVATLTSSLLPTFLPGPASKASLPVIAYYFSPEKHLPSHPSLSPALDAAFTQQGNAQPLLRLALLPQMGSCLLYSCLKPALLPGQFLPSKMSKSEEESTLLLTLQILQGFPASISIHSHLNTHRAPNYILSSLIYSERGNMMTTVQCSVTS